MKKIRFFVFISFLCTFPMSLMALDVAEYGVAENPWPEHYGLHRAVVEVQNDNSFVGVEIPWRLKKSPAMKAMYVIEAQTGAEVKQFARRCVSRDSGFVSFKANKAGLYYVYYMPYKIDDTWAWFKGYYAPRNISTLVRAKAFLEPAKLVRIESRSELDSFYPMEVMPTDDEKRDFRVKNQSEMLIFVENRLNQIRMKQELPYKWIQSGEVTFLKDVAAKNEWYPIQIGVVANQKKIENLKLKPTDFVLKQGEKLNHKIRIASNQMVCINTNGVDPWGNDFTKKVDVAKGYVQPMWLGVDLQNQKPGVYVGEIEIHSDNCDSRTVQVELTVKDELLPNRGDNDLWRLTRLRWLNSRLGLDDNEMIAPFTALKHEQWQFELLGRQVTIGANGLPTSIRVGDKELLAAPISLGENLDLAKVTDINLTNETKYRIDWEWSAESEKLQIEGKAYLEADGYMDFSVTCFAKKTAEASAKLEIPMRKEFATYSIGFDSKGEGRFCPENLRTGWQANRDSFWVGEVDAGLYVEMQGASYTGPMLNLYKTEFAPCWHNDGAGSYGISTVGSVRTLDVSSGERILNANESVTYDFAFIVTPMKQIDWKDHFNTRYYHMTPPMELKLFNIDRENYKGSVDVDVLMNAKAMPVDDDVEKYGINVVNVHQAHPENCYINYPFVDQDRIHDFVTEAHKKDLKVKLYYTVRELTNSCYEIWALRSLGNEVFADGSGGGYIWLQEHLENDYQFAWYSHNGSIDNPDAAIVTSGISRWYNYYVEGLHWMVKEYGIDGVYMDDVTFDRTILKRMRRAMESVKPNCLLDLHSNTGFSIGPTTQYLEFFPYIDRLWFGEHFFYNDMSAEAILTECSGIPFGVGSEMLFRGGNPWRGLLYGMTNRYPWFTDGKASDPRPIWDLWDQIEMREGGNFIGYWEEGAVKTSDNRVKASLYISPNGKKLMVAVASFASTTQEVVVQLDWDALGLHADQCEIFLPEVPQMQSKKKLNSEIKVRVEPIKGAIIQILAE